MFCFFNIGRQIRNGSAISDRGAVTEKNVDEGFKVLTVGKMSYQEMDHCRKLLVP